MLRRALPLALASLLLMPQVYAQQLLTEVPPPAYAARYAEVLVWERYYAQLLHLDAWTITIRFDSLPPGFLANTLSHPATKRALTTFDPWQIASEGEPWRVVLHELLHIASAQIHGFAQQLARGDDEAQTLVQYMFEDLVQRMAVWPVWPKPRKE